MFSLIPEFLNVVASVLAGVGIGHLFQKIQDKTGKLPIPEDAKTKWTPLKIGFFIICTVTGVLVVKFLQKKLHVKLIK